MLPLFAPLAVVAGIIVILVTDLIKPSAPRSRSLALITLVLGFTGSLLLLPTDIATNWPSIDTVMAFDPLAFWFSAMVFLLAFLAMAMSWNSFEEERHSAGEYYSLLLTAVLGAVVVIHSKELITFFIAFELLSIPLYIATGFRRYHRQSAEAGLKYFLSGALSSAVFLFGASWIYGASGSTEYSDMLLGFKDHGQPLLVGILMVMAAFAFKMSSAPFHMWAPDTYEGAPIPVAAFLSSVPKVAMIGAFLRFFLTFTEVLEYELMVIVSALAILSILIGNLVALTQRELTRLAAYSGVAQMGYLLIGVSALLGAWGAGQPLLAVEALGALLFYLFIYTLTNLAFWLILLTVNQSRKSTDLDAFDGLAQTSPALSFALMLTLMSLAGVPPLAGFVGKIYLFRAAFFTQPLMALVGVVGSVLSLYYYFNILRRCYFLKPQADALPVEIPLMTRSVLFVILPITALGGLYPRLAQGFLELAERILIR